MTTLSERLIELKESKNLLQKDIAAGASLSLRSYQRYEYGEREPTSSVLLALADFLDVSIDYLVGRTDNPDSHKTKKGDDIQIG